MENKTTIGEYQISTLVTGGWKENCYLIKHLPGGELALIDPGDDAERIVKIILDAGAKLKHIFLTHAHHDHIGAAAAVSRKFNLPCILHENDKRLLRHSPMYALRFEGRQIKAPTFLSTFGGEPTFDFGNQQIQTFYTPGHTNGSVCYAFDGFIFTGDTLLNHELGRTDLPGSDAHQIKKSAKRLINSVSDDAIIFPGHGDLWTMEEAKIWWSTVDRVAAEYECKIC